MPAAPSAIIGAANSPALVVGAFYTPPMPSLPGVVEAAGVGLAVAPAAAIRALRASRITGHQVTHRKESPRQPKMRADLTLHKQAQTFCETHGRARTALRPANPWVSA